jgi:hypothetical protein
MNYTHVICQFDSIIPIGVVDDFNDIKKFIYDYHHKIISDLNDDEGKYNRASDEFLKDLKFIPFNGKYPDIHGYEGYYEYTDAVDVDKYKIYCSDHYKRKDGEH